MYNHKLTDTSEENKNKHMQSAESTIKKLHREESEMHVILHGQRVLFDRDFRDYGAKNFDVAQAVCHGMNMSIAHLQKLLS